MAAVWCTKEPFFKCEYLISVFQNNWGKRIIFCDVVTLPLYKKEPFTISEKKRIGDRDQEENGRKKEQHWGKSNIGANKNQGRVKQRGETYYAENFKTRKIQMLTYKRMPYLVASSSNSIRGF